MSRSICWKPSHNTVVQKLLRRVVAQELHQAVRLAGPRPEVDVGEED